MSEYGQLDNYKVGRTVGSGFSAKCKIAWDENNKVCAVKVFDLSDPNARRFLELCKEEFQQAQKLDSPVLVKMNKIEEQATYTNKKGKTKQVAYIVSEYVAGGEFYNYCEKGAFTEPICRAYFKDMLIGLHSMHKAGLSHRDLKPDNILLTADFQVKIIDYGFAASLEGRDGSGFNTSQVGTIAYMAPQILAKVPYRGNEVDLFAMAVILFIMYTGHPPFNEASRHDDYYRLLMENKADRFWKYHKRQHDKDFFSEDFMDLFTTMVSLHPQMRLTMSDIIAHKWMQGRHADAGEIKEEFAQRKHAIDLQQEQERAEKEEQKVMQAQKGVGRKDKVYLDLTQEQQESFAKLVPSKYNEEFGSKATTFSSTYNANEVFEKLYDYLQELECKLEMAKDGSMKMRYSVKRPRTGVVIIPGDDSEESEEDEEEEAKGVEKDDGPKASLDEECSVQVEVQKKSDSEVCVAFTRKGGSQAFFYDNFMSTREALRLIDDA